MNTMHRIIRTLAVLGSFSICFTGCAAAPEDDGPVNSAESSLSAAQWTLNVQVPGEFSQEAPAVAALNGIGYMVHSGGSNTSLWWTRYVPNSWTSDSRLGTQSSSATPSLVAFNGFIYMTHVGGSAGSTQVWFSRFDPGTQSWRPDFQLPFQSVGSPTIAAYGGRLYLIGVTPGTGQLWWATMDTSEAFTPSQSLSGMFSSSPPSLAVLNSRLYMVHMAGFTNAMVLNSFDGVNWRGDQTIVGGFNGSIQRSSVPPAIAAYGGILHLVHKEPNVSGIWWSYYTPATGTWAAEVSLPGQETAHFVALAPLSNQLLMVHSGASETTLWYSIFQ